MNIAIHNCGNGASAVIDKMNGNVTVPSEAEGLWVDNPMFEPHTDLPVANTSVSVRNFLLNDELRKAVYESSELKFSSEPTVSTLYAMWNGEKFSDWMEVSHSERFMNGEVGPISGFSTGVGIKVVTDLEEALPTFHVITEFIKGMEYRGEIVIGVSEKFLPTSINFGHFYGHFGTFCEVCKEPVHNVLDFIFGELDTLDIHSYVSVSNVVSVQPFPLLIDNNAEKIRAPNNAEKHLWRIQIPPIEFVLITCHGSNIFEARRRINRTLENMLKFSRDIQYRTDFGHNRKFLFCEEQYRELSRKPQRAVPTSRSAPVVSQDKSNLKPDHDPQTHVGSPESPVEVSTK